ncbi:MAG: Rab family GTPase [Cyanobacteria bacterium P01_E01_bin.42]
MGKVSRKICLVGDFSVGKTSLIRRFVDDQFSDEYLSTVGVKLSQKSVNLQGEDGEDKPVDLFIWDIEGQTQFKGIAPSYLQGAKGAIIVADVKRQETLEHLRNHLDLFFKINPKGWVIVALNKSDLISEDKVEKLLHANQFQADYPKVIGTYATSAKTGKDVNEIFYELAASMIFS